MNNVYDYINDIYEFYRQNGVRIDPVPSVVFDETHQRKLDPFIKTGHYNPQQKEITIYIKNRQLKDILRSFCHELIHHNQNIENYEFGNVEGSLNENSDLEKLESEAFLKGNLMFRKWTEKYTFQK